MKTRLGSLAAIFGAIALMAPVAAMAQLPPGRQLIINIPPTPTPHPAPAQAPSWPYPYNQPYGFPLPNPFAGLAPQVVFPNAPTPSVLPPIPQNPYNTPPSRFVVGYPVDGDDYAFTTVYPYYPYYTPPLAYPSYPAYTPYSSVTYAPTYNIYYPNNSGNGQSGAQSTTPDSAPPQTASPSGSNGWFPYSYDPYADGSAPSQTQQAPQAAPNARRQKQVIPVKLADSLKDIAQAWQSGAPTPMVSDLPSDGSILMRVDGKYVGNARTADYTAVAATQMKRVHTTDFQYSGVQMQSDGSAAAYAVQHYRKPDGAIAPMYLCYTLEPNASSGAYTVVAIDTSHTPLNAAQS